MPGRILKLHRLKRLDDLYKDKKAYAQWRQQNMKFLGKNASWETQSKFYDMQVFAKNYGADALRRYTYPQMLEIEKRELEQYNNSLINKFTEEWASPYEKDGKFNPKKGVGDETTFFKLMNMEPQHKVELFKSGYVTAPSISKKMEQINKEDLIMSTQHAEFLDFWKGDPYENAAVKAGIAFNIQGGYDQRTKAALERNQNKFDRIYTKDVNTKKEKVAPAINSVYNDLINKKYNDTQQKRLYLNTIFPSKNNLGIPQLAAYYDKKTGNIKSDAVKKIGPDEMRMWVAKKAVYDKIFGPEASYFMLNNEAQTYLHDHMGASDWWSDLGNSIIIGASSYTADKINGIRSLYLSAAGGDAYGYQDPVSGEFYGKEFVKNNIYTNPYTKEQKRVNLVKTTESVLDQNGLDSDGYSRSAFFNNKYWSDAESTGLWSKEEQEQAKRLNGFSPSKYVNKPGEENDVIKESLQMMSFSLADAASNAIPFGWGVNKLGQGISLAGRSLNAVQKISKPISGLSKISNYTAKVGEWVSRNSANIGSMIQGTLGAEGIGHAYGRGKFAETLSSNMLKIEENNYRNSENKFYDIYNADTPEGQALRQKVTTEANAIIKNNIVDNIEGYQSMSQQQKNAVINNLLPEVTKQVIRQHIYENAEANKYTPEYGKASLEAAKDATTAALITSWTVGTKYFFINNWGFRQHLFKNSNQLIGQETKNLLGRIKDAANGKITYKELYGTLKNQAKLLGKVTAKQAIGGAWTNYTDELQSSGASRVNDDLLSQYLKGEHDADGQADVNSAMSVAYNTLNGIINYMQGAEENAIADHSVHAGIVGALGSLVSLGPNVMKLSQLLSGKNRREFIDEWNRSNWKEKINMCITNGIINDYYASRHAEKDIKRIVDEVNEYIDNHEEINNFKKILAIKRANMLSNDPNDKEALEFLDAINTIRNLKTYSEQDDLRREVIKKSTVFKDALSIIDKITNDSFTEDELRSYISEYYAKNPDVEQSEDNNIKALKDIRKNAESFRKALDVYDKVEQNINAYEQRTGKYISPIVKNRLIERGALDSFLDKKIADMEEMISGRKEITEESAIESYGNEKGLSKRLHHLSLIQKKLADQRDKAKEESEKAQKEYEDYLDKIIPNENAVEITEEEQKKLSLLKLKADEAKLQHKSLSHQLKQITDEQVKLVDARNALINGEKQRVLTAEEILMLSPEDRERMLDNNSLDYYSKEQQEEITKAKETLNLYNPEILAHNTIKGRIQPNIVESLANYVQKKRANATAFSMMLENPEAAAYQINTDSNNSVHKYNMIINQRRADIYEDWIDKAEVDPRFDSQQKIEDTLYSELLTFGLLNGSDAIKNVMELDTPNITRYSHVFERAINNIDLNSDINNVIKSLNIPDNDKRGLLDTTYNLIDKSNSKEEFLDNLNSITEDSNLLPSVRLGAKLLYNKLNEIWEQGKATKEISQNEKESIQEKSKEKSEEEKKVISDAEEEARLKAEEEAVRKATQQVSDKDADTSNDRTAELAAHGLTEKDLEDNPEIAQEELEEALLKSADVELESPTIEEQASETPDVKVEVASNDDSTNQGNLSTVTNEILLGNGIYGYELISLIEDKKQVLRKGKEGDTLTNFMTWLKNANIKLQEIIDRELKDISKLNPKVFPLYTYMGRNATNDRLVSNIQFLAVEYTPEVQRIHNKDLGGVVTSNGKQYLIIGSLYAKGNQVFEKYKKQINKDKIERKKFFDENPSERFFVVQDRYTQIDNSSISSGRLVKQLLTDKEPSVRTISELLNDPQRNPKGLILEDLKWAIQTSGQLIKINVSDRNIIYPPEDGFNNLGATYLLIETGNGNYIPTYIRPIRLKEIKEGKLKNIIDGFINELRSTDRNVRLNAVNSLRMYINLTKEGNWILVGTDEKPTITLQINGVKKKTFDLNDPNSNIETLKDEIYETLDPRINITSATLRNIESIKMFDEAGALTTDLALLGTSNINYNVYETDANGKPIITIPKDNNISDNEVRSDLSKAQDKNNSEMIGNKTYRKDKEGNWKNEKGQVITDVNLIDQLNYRNIIRTRNLQPVEIIGNDEVFIVNNNKNNPFVLVRRKGSYIFAQSKEGALNTIDRYNKKATEQQRQERLQSEIEKEKKRDEGEQKAFEENKQKALDNSIEVALDESEESTDKIIEEQLLGEERSQELREETTDETPGQKKAQEQFAKVETDSENIELTDDEKAYIDLTTGELMSRVSSIAAADIRGKEFPSDSVWITPSTTLGTGFHKFIEDLLFNKAGNPENYAERYPNATNEELKEVAKQVEDLKQKIKDRELTIAGTEVKVAGELEVHDPSSNEKKVLKVAGSIDLLLYDKEGKFIVWDFKTKRGNIKKSDKIKWALQTYIYSQILKEKYGLVMANPEIVPLLLGDTVDGKYPTPKGATFENGKDMGGTAVYENKDGQLMINGREYKNATADIAPNIELSKEDQDIKFSPEDINIQLSKLKEEDRKRVKVVENSTPSKQKESQDTSKIQSEPVKTSEDINDTGTKSLEELQSKKQLNNVNSIIRSREWGRKVITALRDKFPDMPNKPSELEKFLQDKHINTVNITNVEDWLNNIINCK